MVSGLERYVGVKGEATLAMEGRTWQLCSVATSGTSPVYQIYLTPNEDIKDKTRCPVFQMRTYGNARLVAWEY